MQTIVIYAQVIVGILLGLSILLQQKSAGLSADIAGVSTGAYTASRGIDRLLFWATVIFAIIFFALSIAYLFAPLT